MKTLIYMAACLAFASSALAAPTHREQIISILSKDSAQVGKLDVEVTFLLHCGDMFQQLVTQTVPPISLSNPHIAVQALANSGRACLAVDTKGTATFQVPKIAGQYTFVPVQP
jgi:hypothetical protein